ncbi:hypothetical protein NBRC111894_4679 [Sporolactobacillus inulinus]|uniref:Uncharacterized protein n=1 Tax=Sporolactobacillus inulinus TaxID=2078 RepID=A0A4Y1ZJ32_9BACL|nr:hypothetical protein NBRC111894_4679 [Sporolactobacillus inulinus]
MMIICFFTIIFGHLLLKKLKNFLEKIDIYWIRYAILE